MRSTSIRQSDSFTGQLSRSYAKHVPERELFEHKSTHPWLNERCIEAIRLKNASAGPEAFVARTRECNGIIFEEHTKYIVRMRDKLANEKRGSKSWWKITNEIMQQTGPDFTDPSIESRQRMVARQAFES